MDNDVKHEADFYRLVAWAHARRKQLIGSAAAVAAVVLVVGVYAWHKNYVETSAAEALSKLKLPSSAKDVAPGLADDYVRIANDYSGTMAAGRALLTAGGIYFDGGKFKEAQDQFERFVQQYPDSPLANQALIGVAASLEAQGKLAEATSRYGDFVARHNMDANVPAAKSALARLYTAQNKPEKALQYYTEMVQAGNQDSWTMEAGIQAEELLQKYPELRKPKMAMPATAPMQLSPTPAAPPPVPAAPQPTPAAPPK